MRQTGAVLQPTGGSTDDDLRGRGDYGSAANVGAREARNPVLMIMNPDVTISRLDRDEMARLANGGRMGLIGGTMVPSDSDGSRVLAALQPQHGLLRGAARLAFGPLGLASRLRIRQGSDRQVAVGRARWVVGALLIASREEFLELGGFNERIFLYAEDRDLSFRYVASGLPVDQADFAQGSHALGGSSDRRPEDFARLRAWAILGWLQFLSDSQGVAVARRGWLAYRVFDRIARALVAPGALIVPGSAFRPKAAEFRAIAHAITAVCAAGGRVDGRRFCPDSIAIVTGGIPDRSRMGAGG